MHPEEIVFDCMPFCITVKNLLLEICCWKNHAHEKVLNAKSLQFQIPINKFLKECWELKQEILCFNYQLCDFIESAFEYNSVAGSRINFTKVN